MVYIKLYRHKKLLGVGQAIACEHAGNSLDALINAGYEVRLELKVNEESEIPEELYGGFLHVLNKVIAEAIYGKKK